jgi:hypothetical protein
MKDKEFPNGFASWQETHFEIVQAITIENMKKNPKGVVLDRCENQGHCGLYELAEELTDEFETKYKDNVWDGEFLDYMYSFLEEKLK